MFGHATESAAARRKKSDGDHVHSSHGGLKSTSSLHSSFLLSSRDDLMIASKQRRRGGMGTFFLGAGEGELERPLLDKNGQNGSGETDVPTGLPGDVPDGSKETVVAIGSTNNMSNKDEEQSPEESVTQPDGKQQSPPSLEAGCCCINAGLKVQKESICFKFFRLKRWKIHAINLLAVFLHAVMFAVLAMKEDKQRYVLKFDRTHVTTGALNDMASNKPFLNTTSNSTTCKFAQPNTLNFTRNSAEKTVLQTWTYPKDAGMDISLRNCVAAFFAMSFIFQGIVSLISFLPISDEPWTVFEGRKGRWFFYERKFYFPRGYTNIFSSPDPDDYTLESLTTEEDGKNKSKDKQLLNAVLVWCSRMLAFNVLRFYEYSISGSLVLFTIALVSGISDMELLMCIYVLAFACMIFGLVAEYAMRVRTVINAFRINIVQYMEKDPFDAGHRKSVEFILNIIASQLHVAFWLSHIVAWVCILVPWYIIYMHYLGWWDQCKSTKPQKRSTEPPSFVKAVVWIQIFLYTLFGVVQLVQYIVPHKRRAAEVAYIILSLTAKLILGAILATQVLMG